MKNTEIIYNALIKTDTKLPKLEIIEDLDTSCMVCNKSIREGVRRAKAISGNFTDYDTFKNISGSHICIECTTCLKCIDLRYNNILADKDNIYLFKKDGIEEKLFNLDKYVKTPFIIGITRTFKKHNSFRTSINNNTKKILIRQEDEEYYLDIDNAKSLYEKLYELYMIFTKDEILTGNYSMGRFKDVSLDRFKKLEKEVSRHRNTNQLDLLVYMLDSEVRQEHIEKLKEEKEAKKELKKDKQISLI